MELGVTPRCWSSRLWNYPYLCDKRPDLVCRVREDICEEKPDRWEGRYCEWVGWGENLQERRKGMN